MLKPRLSLSAPRLAITLAWLLALAVCAWLVSDLVLRFITPPSPPAAQHVGVVDPRIAAQQLSARAPLPGEASGDDTRVAASADELPSGFTLHGVATGFGNSPGFALIAPSGGNVTPHVIGETLAPGVTLVELAARHVVIERNGVRETLPLSREQPAVAVLPIPASPPPQAVAPPPATPPATTGTAPPPMLGRMVTQPRDH